MENNYYAILQECEKHPGLETACMVMLNTAIENDSGIETAELLNAIKNRRDVLNIKRMFYGNNNALQVYDKFVPYLLKNTNELLSRRAYADFCEVCKQYKPEGAGWKACTE